MNTTYSNTPIHLFIKEYIESENGEVKDVCEEYFTIKTPALLEPIKYTYKPAIAHEKKIDLIATGSPAYNSIIEESLKKGTLSSVNLNTKVQIQDFIKGFFKDHKINNTKINKIEVLGDKKVKLMLFIYSIFINNKLKKNEEVVKILLDETGSRINEDILNNSSLAFEDSKERISVETFDKYESSANEFLDQMIKDKKNIFDLQLKKEVGNKLITLEKKLDDEKLQKSISKKWEFNEKEWKLKKDSILDKEKESLETFVSVKFLNFLLINTARVLFEVKLNNNAVIKNSLLVGGENNLKIDCPLCNNEIFEGYGTYDDNYVCFECFNQSLDTGEIYSKNFKLNRENTLKEFIEPNSGFICSVCKKQNSKYFEFFCNHDNSKICYMCLESCSKCNKIFSIANLNKSNNTNHHYCPTHIRKCDNCKQFIGIDEIRVCQATGIKVCSCTKFSKCLLCEQEYSNKSIKEGKCPACNNIKDGIESQLISIVKRYNNKMGDTKKWLSGKNEFNHIVIAKGMFSDTLLIIEKGEVIHERKLGLFNKLKGY